MQPSPDEIESDPQHSIPLSGAFLGITAILWLVPFFWAGWKGQPWVFLPKAVSFQHTAAGLFTKRCTLWWDQHIEARGMEDRSFEVPERAVFGMGAFGYRTRLDRILIETQRSRIAAQVRRRLAEHVFRKMEGGAVAVAGGQFKSGTEPHAPSDKYGGPTLKSVQLIRTLWKVGDEALANPAGEWNPPPSTTVTGRSHQVLGTFQLVGGKVVEIRTPRPLEVPRAAHGGPVPNTLGELTPTLPAGTGPRTTRGTRGISPVPQKRLPVVPAPATQTPSDTASTALVPRRAAPARNPTGMPVPGSSSMPIVRPPNGLPPPGPRLPVARPPRPIQPAEPPMGTVPPTIRDGAAK